MKILVEGADCSGKTTLVKELQKLTGWEMVHHTQHTNSIKEFKATIMRHEPLIIDRLWISEQIYGHVMRGASNDPAGDVFELMNEIDHVVVMCVRADTNGHYEHFVDMAYRREEYPDTKQIWRVICAYYQLYFGYRDSMFPGLIGTLTRLGGMRQNSRVIHYDMDTQSATSMAETIHAKCQ